MEQPTFADLEYAQKSSARPGGRSSWSAMDASCSRGRSTPWQAKQDRVPYYPKALSLGVGGGRIRAPLSVMLRVHCVLSLARSCSTI